MKTKRKTKWKNRYYIDIYRFAAQGLTDEQIAQALAININTWIMWKKKRPSIRYALEQARDKESRRSVKSYMNYVYEQLPENLQELWLKIQAIEDEPNAIARIEKILEGGGKYARMQMFLHALVAYNFNPSRAMRAVNISKKTLDAWINMEPGFADLIDEMTQHKKNFAEEALFKLVAKGDPNAVIFVNRTLNKDRGYADNKLTIEHTGEVKHAHEHRHLIDLDKLELPFEVRKAILDAFRAQKAKEEKNTLLYRVSEKSPGRLEAKPIEEGEEDDDKDSDASDNDAERDGE